MAQVSIFITCTHCVLSGSYDPFMYRLEEAFKAVAEGRSCLICQGVRRVRLDLLAPDLLFADVATHSIAFEELQIVKHLGAGAFGTVDSALWKNQVPSIPAIPIARLTWNWTGCSWWL